jgi:hypothetical protein
VKTRNRVGTGGNINEMAYLGRKKLEASQSVQSKKGGEDPDLLLSCGKSKPSCKSLSGMKEYCFGFKQL